MRNLLAVCFVCVLASAGFAADIGSPIPLPPVKAGCDCPATGVCNCLECTCVPVVAQEETVALLDYEEAQVLAVQTNQPMLTYVGETAPARRVGRIRGFVQARRSTLFGSSRPRLVLSTPRAGAMYWNADLPVGASLPAIQASFLPELKTLDPGRGVVQLSTPVATTYPAAYFQSAPVCVGGNCGSPMFYRR